ncbi:hypothetical protein FOA43_000459 [Brettanomyces nanus]|uniref:Transcription elongation factor Eaf N-terminal domain-containing protein n=1 Tax=Eeniella nana TaxID=13502 RepID=A0A875RX89_EENNA|nr:uncharacterized protein FOA43_000459 [Brettanomyces nanus]QPG73153.1 hypothetical protein FOA43_000459 [Brettanomyces nanus]
MAPDNIIEDGKYEVDMSGLFCSQQLSDVFGIRFGFRPETIDDSYSSLLVKDVDDDLYILKTEAKENTKAVTSLSHDRSTRQDHILFEGKMPQSTIAAKRTVSHSSTLSSPSSPSLSAGSPSIARGLAVTNPYNTPLAMSSLSDFILLYDDVAKKFRMERFNGVIKLSKSREPEVLEKRLRDIEKKRLSSSLNPLGSTTSVVDSLLQSAKLDDTAATFSQHINRISFLKKKSSSVPPQISDLVRPSSYVNSPSLSDSNSVSPLKIVKPKIKQRRRQKQKQKSELLRAAQRAVAKSPRMFTSGESKLTRKVATRIKGTKGGDVKIVTSGPSKSGSTTGSPERSSNAVSDSEVSENSSSQSTEHVMSDEDLAEFADELEEELDEDHKGATSVSRSIDDVLEKVTNKNSKLDDLKNTGLGGLFHVTVEDNPRRKNSLRPTMTTAYASDSASSIVSPLPRGPISMRKLAVTGNLISRGSTPLGLSSPNIRIDTPNLGDEISSPDSSPLHGATTTRKIQDKAKDDEIDFDEEELDRALDDLDDEISEAE